MDLEIRQFEENLIAFINQANLPIEVKRLVLVETMQKVNDACNKVITEEINIKESNNGLSETELASSDSSH